MAEDERVTREGATVGTFDYVAPEQARHSHAADIRSDIYSLGCTLYHMVTGQVPFPSPSLPEKLFAHQALEPTPLNQLIPSIDPNFVEVIQRMMRKVPDERYSTPLQVAQALEPFIDESPRIQDGELAPIPLIVEEPTERLAILTPASPTVQPSALVPATEQQPQVAITSGKTSSSPSPEPDGSLGTVPVPSFLTPVSESEASNGVEDIPLSLDLGPEPTLTDSLSRSKPWFGSNKPARAQKAPRSISRNKAAYTELIQSLLSPRRDLRFRWIGTVGIILALLAVGFVFVRWLGSSTAKHTAIQPPRQSPSSLASA